MIIPLVQRPPGLIRTQIRGGVFDERYVVSSRARTPRNLRGLSLPPGASRAERREVERVFRTALAELEGDFAGTYRPLKAMTKTEQEQLINVRRALHVLGLEIWLLVGPIAMICWPNVFTPKDFGMNAGKYFNF